jgi:hypothetical protein
LLDISGNFIAAVRNRFLKIAAIALHKDEWKRIQELMTQYADMPLDMADASLVSAAERLNDRKVFSIDNLLRAVRMRGGHFFDFVPIGP